VQKFLFAVEILTKHCRGLLFCRTLYTVRNIRCNTFKNHNAHSSAATAAPSFL